MKAICRAGLALAFLSAFTPAQKPSDDDIRTHVMTSILVDPRVMSADIDISVADGFVTLTGRVASLAAREFAIKEVEKIAGVKGVTDELRIDAAWRPDTDISQDIRHRLVNHSRMSASAIGVRCEDGAVTLTGAVPAYVEKQLATELASEVRGVRKVTNEMTVDYTWTRGDTDVEKDVRDALGLDVFLTGLPVQVGVANGTVTLTGTVGSSYIRHRAEDNIRWLPGVREVVNNLTVAWWEGEGERTAAPAVGDDKLAENVRHQLARDTRIDASKLEVGVVDGDVSLSGSVPSAYMKDIAAQDAKDTVGVAWVSDHVQVRAPQRTDAAIRSDVLWELRGDYLFWDTDLDATVKDGVVTLAGKLHSNYEKGQAERIALRINGVRAVVDDVAVIASLADASVEKSVERRLFWSWSTFWVRKAIKVAVSDGTVTLSGNVKSWSQREAAGRIAHETPGVWRVYNQLHVDGYPYVWEVWSELPTPSH